MDGTRIDDTIAVQLGLSHNPLAAAALFLIAALCALGTVWLLGGHIDRSGGGEDR